MSIKNILTPTIGSIFFLVGSGMLVGSFFAFNHTQNFVNTATVATGTVIELRPQRSNKSTTYTPIVKYKNNQGAIVEMKSNVSSNPPEYQVGQTVEVLYNQNNPNDAEINSFWSLWLLFIVLAGMGGSFTIMGLIMHLNKI